MTTESTPAKVRLSDQLGHASEAQPLLERLEEGGCGEYCDRLGREASAALQSLQESYGQLLAENVRLKKYATHCDELIAAYKAASMTEQRVRELVIECLVKWA